MAHVSSSPVNFTCENGNSYKNSFATWDPDSNHQFPFPWEQSTTATFYSNCRRCGMFFASNINDYELDPELQGLCSICRAVVIANRKDAPDEQLDVVQKDGRKYLVRHKHGETRVQEICPVCGKAYVPVDHRQKFCSDQCRDTNKFFADIGNKVAKCPQCGQSFQKRSNCQRFCSAKCRQDSRKSVQHQD